MRSLSISSSLLLVSVGLVSGVALVVACGAGPTPSLADGAPDAAPTVPGTPPTGGPTQGGTCGTCTVTGPLRTVTADTDVAQLVTGDTSDGKGPLVITDVESTYDGTYRLFAGVGPTPCAVVAGGRYLGTVNDQGTGAGGVILPRAAIHGARIVVKSGETLCTQQLGQTTSGVLAWSGFKPYGL